MLEVWEEDTAMQDRDTKLKPCPFCGKDADYITQFINDVITMKLITYHVVGCKKCGIGFRKEEKQEAFDKWNTRVVAE